jgi:pSer/pThr/pTyr-binding forkhead associated (FHA) protein
MVSTNGVREDTFLAWNSAGIAGISAGIEPWAGVPVTRPDPDLEAPDDEPVDPCASTVSGVFGVEEVQNLLKPHVLQQVRGPGSPHQVVLRAERLVVGRAPECEIFLDSSAISRHHMLITRRGPEYACEDCASTNGVFLNGVRIHSAVLREGDQIQVGDVVFIYHEGV